MLRRSIPLGLAVAAIAFASLAAACGGGESKNEATPTTGAIVAQKSPAKVSPTRIPATAVPATGPALVVTSKGKTPYVPTVEEFRALPQTTVKGQSGVTLAALASKAGLGATTVATINGVAKGSNDDGATRYPLKDIASNTIFVVDDSGHIHLVSDVIPEGEWLTLVTSITLE